jgi:redox-sensing transcriptional repressor
MERCSKEDTKGIPPSVLARMTRYFAHAQNLSDCGKEWVSSHELAETLGLTSSTVRQDLSYLDFSGISKRGYEVLGLKKVVGHLLGADEVWHTVMVGAGNLGSALALHEEFARRGFLLCGIFDADPAKVGRKFGAFRVQDMDRLPTVIGEQKVHIGIIAVPAMAAQRVADLLIASGICGLLNLTLTHIIAPRRVAVVDARIVASLQELAYSIMTGRRNT